MDITGIEDKFEDTRVYNLCNIETMLKVSRQTLKIWINEGVNKEITKDDKVFKSKLKLKAQMIGGKWKVLGINIKDFIREHKN